MAVVVRSVYATGIWLTIYTTFLYCLVLHTWLTLLSAEFCARLTIQSPSFLFSFFNFSFFLWGSVYSADAIASVLLARNFTQLTEYAHSGTQIL